MLSSGNIKEDLRLEFHSLLYSTNQSYLNKMFDECYGQEVILFGTTGGLMAPAKHYLSTKKIVVKYCVDNSPAKQGMIYDGIKCISPDELQNIPDPLVIITAYRVNEIFKQLIEIGIKRIYNIPRIGIDVGGHEFLDIDVYKSNSKKLVELYDMLGDDLSRIVLYNRIKIAVDGDFNIFKTSVNESRCLKWGVRGTPQDAYWPDELFELSEDEVFVDVGAADGDTIDLFLKSVDNKFSYIYAFEPDKDNFNKLLNKYEKLNNIECINKGLGCREEKLQFVSAGPGSYFPDVGTRNNNKWGLGYATNCDDIPIISFDQINSVDKISLVKMDIEGFEVEALHGMERMIKKSMPKMSVCLYHRPEHLYEVPLFIRRLNPGYKLFLRQYTDSIDELICHSKVS